MAREYFCAYHSYLRSTRNLSDEEMGKLFRALLRYSAGDAAAGDELQGGIGIAFDFIVDQIDRDAEAYEAKCRTNRDNRRSSSTTVHERQRPSTNVNDRDQEKEEGKGKEEGEDKGEPTTPPTPPAGGVAEAAEDRSGEVLRAWRELNPTASQASIDAITEYCRDPGEEVCLLAIQAARDAGKASWNYLRGIIQRRKDAGIRTAAEWRKAEEAYRRGRSGAGPPPDWSGCPDDSALFTAGE